MNRGRNNPRPIYGPAMIHIHCCCEIKKATAQTTGCLRACGIINKSSLFAMRSLLCCLVADGAMKAKQASFIASKRRIFPSKV